MELEYRTSVSESEVLSKERVIDTRSSVSDSEVLSPREVLPRPGRYYLVKARCGGVAFWRKLVYAVKRNFTAYALKVSTRTFIYLIPVDAIDIDRVFDVSFLELQLEFAKWNDLWLYRVEVLEKGWYRALRIEAYQYHALRNELKKVSEYVVHPNARIRKMFEDSVRVRGPGTSESETEDLGAIEEGGDEDEEW